MDEATQVRALLERAMLPEPPMGPMLQNALRAGLRLRRRRIRGTAAAAALVAVACVVASAVTGATGNQAATPGSKNRTVYVLGTGMRHNTVTPIFVSAASNTAGQPIAVRPGSADRFSSWGTQTTSNGKTIYVVDGSSAVLPISTATNRAARPIELAHSPGQSIEQLAVAPDGKTLYVLGSGFAVTPISTATNRPGKPVELPLTAMLAEMAITPDGRTLYVAFIGAGEPSYSYVIPIDTVTNTPGKRILVAGAVQQIVAAPDGKTVYVIGNIDGEIAVTPIATATNTPGEQVNVATGNVSISPPPVVMTPNGQTMYIPGSNATNTMMYVIAFAAATNRPGKVFRFQALSIDGMAVTPNGRTLYVASQPPGAKDLFSVPGDPDAYSCASPQGDVTPIATATNSAGRPIRVGCRPLSIAVTPDGKTIYVGASSNTMTPIDTATDSPGTPVNVLQPEEITIAP